MEVKLYVGNLPQSTTENDLRTLFVKAGGVASVALIKDRDTGNSRGFAFVGMHTQREAQKAISMLNAFDLNGYKLRVVWLVLARITTVADLVKEIVISAANGRNRSSYAV